MRAVSGQGKITPPLFSICYGSFVARGLDAGIVVSLFSMMNGQYFHHGSLEIKDDVVQQGAPVGICTN